MRAEQRGIERDRDDGKPTADPRTQADLLAQHPGRVLLNTGHPLARNRSPYGRGSYEILQAPSFGGASTSMSSLGPGTEPSGS